MGVLSALLRFCDVHIASDAFKEAWFANPLSEVASLAAYCCLIGYFVVATKGKK